MDQGQTKVQLTGLTVARGPIPPSLNLKSPRPGIAFLDKHHDPKRLLVACAPEACLNREGESQSGINESESGAPTWLDVGSLKTEGRKELPAGEWWNGLPKGIRQSGKISFDIPMPPVPAASASAEGGIQLQ
jgi:methionyl-tRNA formyltransferase